METVRTGIQLRVLPLLAVTQAKAGNVESSRALFERTLKLILSSIGAVGSFLNPESETIERLCNLAIQQGRAGMDQERRRTFEIALERANQIADRMSQAVMYRNIALAQVRSGEFTESERTVARLYQNVESKEARNHEFKVTATKAVAAAYYDSGNRPLAESYRSKLVHLVQESLNNPRSQAQGLLDLAVLSAHMGDSEQTDLVFKRRQALVARARLGPLEKTQDTLTIVKALIESKQNQLAIKLLGVARQSAIEIRGNNQDFVRAASSLVWQDIALMYAKLGNTYDAIEAGQRIANSQWRVNEEYYRALADLNAGNMQAAVQHLKKTVPVDLDLLAKITRDLARSGDVRSAIECFDLLRAGIAEAPHIKAIKELFATQEEHPDYLEALQALAAARAAAGEENETVQWVQTLSTVEEHIYGLLGAAEGTIKYRQPS